MLSYKLILTNLDKIPELSPWALMTILGLNLYGVLVIF